MRTFHIHTGKIRLHLDTFVHSVLHLSVLFLLNYMLSYERVETALETEEMPETTRQHQPAYFAEIEKRLTEWTGKDGYTRPGLTIGELAGTLGTNRTYLADYIKSVYHVTFREWIAALRIEYAKRLLSEHPDMTVGAIAEASGFLSLSYFTRIFSEKEGASPAKWKLRHVK